MARILLVNDEPDLMEVCQMALEIAGHTVETCVEGLVLVISALEGLGPEARRLGAAGFLPKPFRAEELINAVNKLLAERQSENAHV